ncbi:ABC transporter permease [Nocardiopsis synnemataformans]|uniref:ABC transporter permease n=1 Tax=Nocardiopsis synnemataformans TaxID=61305 RepID=UPI003EB7E235
MAGVLSPRQDVRRPRTGSRARPRRRNLPWVAIVIIAVFLVAGIFAPWLAPGDPYAPNLAGRLQPPSGEHLLGTDSLGRDLLSRLVYGARTTLVVVVVSLLISAVIGIGLGLVAGYFRGKVDTFVSRTVDATLAIPSIFIALALAASRGPGESSVIIAVTLILWARFTRVVRSDVLSLSEQDFVAQAAVTGCTRRRTMMVHILPNVMNSILVLVSINMGYVIMLEASLSFLGAGVPPPTPSWGSMISEGQEYIGLAWWISIVPGVAITLIVLALNVLGDWLRDYMDPRMRDAL